MSKKMKGVPVALDARPVDFFGPLMKTNREILVERRAAEKRRKRHAAMVRRDEWFVEP